MANRFSFPIEQVVNSDASDVGAGWKLNFYSTGTSTRKDTFSDNGLTTANANPVVADSAGRFGNIFYESGVYRVVLTDADDVEIWDADPVDGAIGTSGAVEERDASFAVVVDDATKTFAIDASGGPVTVTLLDAATAGNGFEITLKKTDASVNAITIDGNGAETIDGETTVELTMENQSITLRCDVTNWQVLSSYVISGWVEHGQVNANSGTAVDFGSVPPWVREIVLTFEALSTDGTQLLIVQLGDSGGVEDSSYSSRSHTLTTSPSVIHASSSEGFAIADTEATAIFKGACTLSLVDRATNTWEFSAQGMRNDAARMWFAEGRKSLSGTLTQVRITTEATADDFDGSGVAELKYRA